MRTPQTPWTRTRPFADLRGKDQTTVYTLFGFGTSMRKCGRCHDEGPNFFDNLAMLTDWTRALPFPKGAVTIS
eukprot:9889849-Lingulodinium_polyedra.AAC.1